MYILAYINMRTSSYIELFMRQDFDVEVAFALNNYIILRINLIYLILTIQYDKMTTNLLKEVNLCY